MTTPPDNGSWQQRDLVPRPDPTVLTSEAIERVTEQYRRDLDHLRELISTRLDAIDARAAQHDTQSGVIRAEIAEQIDHLQEMTWERFASIDRRFADRDLRAADGQRADREALQAALASARELVQLQNAANTRENEKTSQTLLVQVQATINRVDELKERIDRGEGISSGTAGQRTESRAAQAGLNQNVLVAIALVSLLVAVVSAVAFIVKK